MKLTHVIATTAAVAALGLAAPVMAQDAEAGPGSQDATADDNQVDDGDSNTQNEDSLQNSLNNNLNGWTNFNNDNAADQDNDQLNGNSAVSATQILKAVNTNMYLDEVVDLDGEDDTDTAVGYNSGNNSVNDSAFAAFAGILNQSFNTGIDANTQSATNIAAHGTVSFGDTTGGGGGGGGDSSGD